MMAIGIGCGFAAGVVACWLLKGSVLGELQKVHAKLDRIIAAARL